MRKGVMWCGHEICIMGIMARDGILDQSCRGRSIVQVTSLLEAGPRHVSFYVGAIVLMDGRCKLRKNRVRFVGLFALIDHDGVYCLEVLGYKFCCGGIVIVIFNGN